MHDSSHTLRHLEDLAKDPDCDVRFFRAELKAVDKDWLRSNDTSISQAIHNDADGGTTGVLKSLCIYEALEDMRTAFAMVKMFGEPSGELLAGDHADIFLDCLDTADRVAETASNDSLRHDLLHLRLRAATSYLNTTNGQRLVWNEETIDTIIGAPGSERFASLAQCITQDLTNAHELTRSMPQGLQLWNKLNLLQSVRFANAAMQSHCADALSLFKHACSELEGLSAPPSSWLVSPSPPAEFMHGQRLVNTMRVLEGLGWSPNSLDSGEAPRRHGLIHAMGLAGAEHVQHALSTLLRYGLDPDLKNEQGETVRSALEQSLDVAVRFNLSPEEVRPALNAWNLICSAHRAKESMAELLTSLDALKP